MRFVVLDTNVIVSAGINADGAPAQILMNWILERQVQLVTSPAVIAEYYEVVGRQKFRRYGFPPSWLGFVVEESLQLIEPKAWGRPLPDLKDAPFLALAHGAGAWLVTGNIKHFPEDACGGVRVLSPGDYLARLEQ